MAFGARKCDRAALAGAAGVWCREGTRTPTVLPPPGPEPGASTNSAISAQRAHYFMAKRRMLSKRRCRCSQADSAIHVTIALSSSRNQRRGKAAGCAKPAPGRSFLAREQQRYEDPLPSREYILVGAARAGRAGRARAAVQAARHRRRRETTLSAASRTRWSATARSCATGAARSASWRSSI